MKPTRLTQCSQPDRDSRLSWLLRLGMIGLVCLGSFFWPQPLAAQQATGRVVVTGVDDSAFPVVQLAVDVFGANGAPLTNLGVNDFRLTEDGQPVTVRAVTADTARPLALLLALDRSTDAATWSALQTTVAGALAGLRNDDQIALTTFFDEVQLVQDFTTDKTAVINALTGLTPGGEFSAVNRAAVDAVSRFTATQPPRRAVVLVADAPDNVSGLSTENAIAQLTGAGLPLYIVGVGPRVQAEPTFAALAQATGGRYLAIPTADQLGAILASLIQELIQGYRVEFVSALPADGQSHTVTVAVTGVTATGTGSFTAQPGEVSVSLGDLTDGLPVAGLVSLTVAAQAPAPIAAVEYRVGDTLIGTVTDPATPVIWDTATVAPGLVTLRAIVQDSAGNRGEATAMVQVVNAAPRLELVAVEDDAYPALTFYVDAFGGNGLPLVGLTAANFAVRLGDQDVALNAQVDATQPVQTVLVLDRSVSAADWVQLRAAANALADTMRPQDRMAVYTFAGTVALLQAVTADGAAIRRALATVEPQVPPADGVPPRALHQAILDALNLADTLPPGRRSVVVLTGGGDTLGQIAPATLVDLLQELRATPVHMLAFGVDGNRAATLAGIAQLTGGNGVAVNNAGDLRSAAQTLALLLQQGYRLDVQAALPANDQSYSATLRLNAGEVTAETRAEFIARRGAVTVTIPNLAAGATVAGAVDLTAQAEAPAPITAVVYRLNGEVLAEVADIAARILWNSDTYPPGAYTLEVTVTDAVGNQGAASVAFTVVPPVTLQARLGAANTDGPIVVGDEITIDALPAAVGTLSIVEFYVDGVQVGSATQPPYRAVFDSSRFAPGTREVRVVARDRDGYEAVVLLPLTLTEPAPTPVPTEAASGIISGMPTLPSLTAGLGQVNWGRWLTIGGIVLGLLLLFFGFMSLLRAARLAAQQQKLTPMRLSLTNQGNVATAYLLRGEDPAGLLTFRFSIGGVPLGLPPVARLAREENGATVAAGSAGRVGGVSVGLPASVQGAAAGVAMPKSLGEVGDKLNEVSAVGRIIADILISVAFFLPRPLSQPLRMVAMQIRRGQMLARRVQYVRRQVDRLNQTEMGSTVVQTTTEAAEEAGRVATAAETRQAVAGAGRSAGSAVVTTAGAAMSRAGRTANKLFDLTAATARQAGDQAAAALGIAPAGTRQWVYVPTVNPGETVTIEVLVGTQGRLRGAKHQPFRILTRALGEEDAQPVIEEGSVRVTGSSWWVRNLPRLLLIGVALLGLVAVWVAVMVWWG